MFLLLFVASLVAPFLFPSPFLSSFLWVVRSCGRSCDHVHIHNIMVSEHVGTNLTFSQMCRLIVSVKCRWGCDVKLVRKMTPSDQFTGRNSKAWLTVPGLHMADEGFPDGRKPGVGCLEGVRHWIPLPPPREVSTRGLHGREYSRVMIAHMCAHKCDDLDIIVYLLMTHWVLLNIYENETLKHKHVCMCVCVIR